MENEIIIDLSSAKIKKYLPLLSVIALLLTGGYVVGSYLLHYYTEKPAGITVVSNYYTVTLYDSVDLTTEVSSVNFPPVLYDDLEGETSTSPSYWLHGDMIESGKPVTCMWNSTCGTLYPDDLVLTAEYYDTDHWAAWTENTGTVTLTDTDSTIKVRFVLDAADAYVSSYSFDIGILALSNE